MVHIYLDSETNDCLDNLKRLYPNFNLSAYFKKCILDYYMGESNVENVDVVFLEKQMQKILDEISEKNKEIERFSDIIKRAESAKKDKLILEEKEKQRMKDLEEYRASMAKIYAEAIREQVTKEEAK